MKRTIRLIAFVTAFVLVLAALLCSCDFFRKVNGAEVKFQNKVSSAKAFSFDMHLTVQSGSDESELDVSCFKKNNDYAYTFANPGNSAMQYRKLFGDNCLYEFVRTARVGSYHTREGVSYTSEDNFLYVVTKNIMLATYATLLSKAQDDKVGDKAARRYDISNDGNDYSLWYDEENLVKIRAVIRQTDESGNTSTDTYTAVFSNYAFENVAAEPFLRPAESTDAVYVESPVSFEQWMSSLDRFASCASHWAS